MVWKGKSHPGSVCVWRNLLSVISAPPPLPNASLSGWCHQCCRWCHRCVLWLPNALPLFPPIIQPCFPSHRVCCLSSCWSEVRGHTGSSWNSSCKNDPISFEREPRTPQLLFLLGEQQLRRWAFKSGAACCELKRPFFFKEATMAATASVSSAVTATNFCLLIHWCFSSLLPRLNQQWLG